MTWDTYETEIGAISVQEAGNRIVVAKAAMGVQVATIWGHLKPTMSHAIVTHAIEMLATYPYLLAFHNWASMTGYDTPCREQLTRWAMRHKHDSKLHLALRSPIVSMGVAVANLALGNVLVVHRNVESLQAALRDASSAAQRQVP